MKKILSPKELQALKKPFVEVKSESAIFKRVGNNIVLTAENRIIFT